MELKRFEYMIILAQKARDDRSLSWARKYELVCDKIADRMAKVQPDFFWEVSGETDQELVNGFIEEAQKHLLHKMQLRDI